MISGGWLGYVLGCDVLEQEQDELCLFFILLTL
jgi:hypothetical protein